jgi:tetratricopeptide (TPR) repeat protein
MARITQRLGLTRFEADEYYQQALASYRKAKPDTAILQMTDAIALLPTRAEYYAARGYFYLGEDNKEKALADFEKALKLDRLEMLAHYGRGMIAYKDKNWEEALAHFGDAYKADPKRPETLYYLALTYHRKGSHEVARRLMDMAVSAFAENDKRRGDAQKWVKEFDKILGGKVMDRLAAPKNNPG